MFRRKRLSYFRTYSHPHPLEHPVIDGINTTLTTFALCKTSCLRLRHMTSYLQCEQPRLGMWPAKINRPITQSGESTTDKRTSDRRTINASFFVRGGLKAIYKRPISPNASEAANCRGSRVRSRSASSNN